MLEWWCQQNRLLTLNRAGQYLSWKNVKALYWLSTLEEYNKTPNTALIESREGRRGNLGLLVNVASGCSTHVPS